MSLSRFSAFSCASSNRLPKCVHPAVADARPPPCVELLPEALLPVVLSASLALPHIAAAGFLSADARAVTCCIVDDVACRSCCSARDWNTPSTTASDSSVGST